MNKKAIALIALVLFSAVFIAGCTAPQPAIRSAQEATRTVENVSTNVGRISGILDDVDRSLSGG